MLVSLDEAVASSDTRVVDRIGGFNCFTIKIRTVINQNDCPQALSFVKRVDSFVYLFKTVYLVCDELGNIKFTSKNLLTELRNLGATLPATEGSTLPLTTSHQLEWTS